MGKSTRQISAAQTAATSTQTPQIKTPRHARAFDLVRDDYFRPAAARRMAALSVRSQVNSGSSRPKWPYAAVLA